MSSLPRQGRKERACNYRLLTRTLIDELITSTGKANNSCLDKGASSAEL